MQEENVTRAVGVLEHLAQVPVSSTASSSSIELSSPVAGATRPTTFEAT
jgi:hypothetical protein